MPWMLILSMFYPHAPIRESPIWLFVLNIYYKITCMLNTSADWSLIIPVFSWFRAGGPSKHRNLKDKALNFFSFLNERNIKTK